MPNDPVAIARSLIDVPFRVHGRVPATGLDCVGLIALAYGRQAGVPTGYALRGGSVGAYEAMLEGQDFFRRAGDWHPADLLMLRPGPAQIHLGVWTGDSLVHADAGIGRIVEAPGVPRWPVLSAWRFAQARS